MPAMKRSSIIPAAILEKVEAANRAASKRSDVSIHSGG